MDLVDCCHTAARIRHFIDPTNWMNPVVRLGAPYRYRYVRRRRSVDSRNSSGKPLGINVKKSQVPKTNRKTNSRRGGDS